MCEMNGTNDAKKRERRRFVLLNEPIFPLLVKTSVPTVVGMLVMVIYNLTDTFFVGMLGNKSMTAAIGIVFSFVSFIQAIGFWFGYGSGNVMSKKLGAGEEREAEILSSLGIVFALVVGIFIAVLSRMFLLPLAKLLGGNASEPLFRCTVEYLNIILVAVPFSLYSVTLYNQLRLCGNVKDGMTGLLSGMLANMVLDPVLMFGWNVGFVGAGYATLIGQVIGCVALTVLSRRHGNISPDFRKAEPNRQRIYHILAGGMPNFSRQAVTSVALILLHVTAAKYGDGMIAAFTISSRIFAFAYMVMIGWGQGFQPICAMNYGAGKVERVKKAFRLTVATGTGFLAVSAILLAVFSEPLMRTMSRDGEVIAAGAQLLRLQCMTMPLLGFFAVSSMLMQNIGKYFYSFVISVSRQGIFYLPLLFLLPTFFGKFGLYVLQPVADVFSFLLAVFLVVGTVRAGHSKAA